MGGERLRIVQGRRARRTTNVREVVVGLVLLGVGAVPVWVFLGRGEFSAVEIAFVAMLGGGAILGGLVGVHQFVRIGRNSYIGGYTAVLQDILPFAKISQTRDSYNFYGPNSIGMVKNGISREFINNIKDIVDLRSYSPVQVFQSSRRINKDILVGFR